MSKKVGVLAIVGLVGIGLVVFTAFALWPQRVSGFDVALAQIKACGKEAHPVNCARPIVQKLLETESASELMDALAANLSPMRCHYVGHVVGQQAYVKNQDLELTLAQCDRSCDSACVHGAIGEVFVEKLGLGTPDDEIDVDLQHLNPDDIRTIGRQLCTTAEPCHGVGHAIYQSTGDMKKAMALCVNIGPYVTSCFNGVAMEYADILASRNMRDNANAKLATPETISSLCTQLPNITQQRSCFRYYPRMIVETFMAHGYSESEANAQVEKVCLTFKSTELQSACYSGIGSHNGYYILTDQAKAVAACQNISNPLNQAACYFGEVDVAVEERQNKLIPYCGKLPNAELQSSCYQTVFFFLNKFKVPSDNALRLCGDNAMCKRGYENKLLNPWEQMNKNFSK